MPRLGDESFALHVAPRYTCGSPAWVSRKVGMEVAKEEERAYMRTLSGRYGEKQRINACVMGLSKIVYERISMKRGVATYKDILTGETWTVKL
jgi:hypothetical protein